MSDHKDDVFLFQKREFLNKDMSMVGNIIANVQVNRFEYNSHIEDLRKLNLYTNSSITLNISDCSRQISLDLDVDEDDDEGGNKDAKNSFAKIDLIIETLMELRHHMVEARKLTVKGKAMLKQLRKEREEQEKKEVKQ